MAVKKPVYQDTKYTYSGETLNYRIEGPLGTVLLRGTASTRPDGTPPTIYVNRQIEPFMNQDVKPVTGLTTEYDASRTFFLFDDSEGGSLLETYTFIRSYSGDWSGANKRLSDPIRPNISAAMLVPFTQYVSTQTSITLQGKTN